MSKFNSIRFFPKCNDCGKTILVKMIEVEYLNGFNNLENPIILCRKCEKKK